MRSKEFTEAITKPASFAFGRFNPPTIGHQKLISTIQTQPGDHFLFLTHTQKANTDPLGFAEKLFFAQQMFKGIKVGDPNVRTIIQAMQKLESMGYTDITYVAGSDRVKQFSELLNKYNGSEYQFDNINTVNAGTRDPDSDGVEVVSGSRVRDMASRGDEINFLRAIPGDRKLAKMLYNKLRSKLNVPA